MDCEFFMVVMIVELSIQWLPTLLSSSTVSNVDELILLFRALLV